jgi:tetratricopeptide (TPR) repeat protein
MKPNDAGYTAQLQHVDQVLGGFRDFLIREGFWDQSVVLLLSDHGESLGEHGESAHGYFVYESTLHVPLLIHWPGGQHPQLADRPAGLIAGLIDVAPTILDFLHIAKPPSFRGRSLTAGTGPVFSESVYARDTFGWAPLFALRESSLKYVDAPKPELYDLAKDPAERVNVIALHPNEAAAMKARIAQLTTQRATGAPALSAETRAMLGSLGYTAGGKQTATAIDPKDRITEEEAYEDGLSLLYTGAYTEAVRTLNRVLEKDPKNLPALCALGESYFRAGDAKQALKLWQQVLDRDSHYRPAAESVARACLLIPKAPQCVAH